MEGARQKCKATVVGTDGNEVKVFTRDLRMESLLTTALREGWKIGYHSFDPRNQEITRGKLNIEDQKRK
jgi:hypothetical protein